MTAPGYYRMDGVMQGTWGNKQPVYQLTSLLPSRLMTPVHIPKIYASGV